MLSTNEDSSNEMIGALFDDFILPLALKAQTSGDLSFPSIPDSNPQSYYVRPARATMTHEDFTAASCLDCDDFAQRLAAYWKTSKRDDLLISVPRFEAVARVVQANFDIKEHQEAVISELIYVMF